MSIATFTLSEASISAQAEKAVKTPRKRQFSAVPDDQLVPEPR